MGSDGSLVLSNAYSRTGRVNLTISTSADGGEWTPRVVINAGGSGYSSIANIPRQGEPGAQTVGVLYERNGGYCPEGSLIAKMAYLALDVKVILTPPCIFHY
jgi:hypothetical protein